MKSLKSLRLQLTTLPRLGRVVEPLHGAGRDILTGGCPLLPRILQCLLIALRELLALLPGSLNVLLSRLNVLLACLHILLAGLNILLRLLPRLFLSLLLLLLAYLIPTSIVVLAPAAI